MCGEVHAPFWEVRRGPRALRTEARGCAPRAGFPTTCRGAAWGTLGGWTRPRTSAIVKQRTHLTTPTSHLVSPPPPTRATLYSQPARLRFRGRRALQGGAVLLQNVAGGLQRRRTCLPREFTHFSDTFPVSNETPAHKVVKRRPTGRLPGCRPDGSSDRGTRSAHTGTCQALHPKGVSRKTIPKGPRASHTQTHTQPARHTHTHTHTHKEPALLGVDGWPAQTPPHITSTSTSTTHDRLRKWWRTARLTGAARSDARYRPARCPPRARPPTTALRRRCGFSHGRQSRHSQSAWHPPDAAAHRRPGGEHHN